MRRTTIGLLGLSAVLACLAWVVLQSLADRQIAGAERVLHSLRSEAQVLDQQWTRGALPARTLQAEQDHIQEESEQQVSQLSELRASHG